MKFPGKTKVTFSEQNLDDAQTFVNPNPGKYGSHNSLSTVIWLWGGDIH